MSTPQHSEQDLGRTMTQSNFSGGKNTQLASSTRAIILEARRFATTHEFGNQEG